MHKRVKSLPLERPPPKRKKRKSLDLPEHNVREKDALDEANEEDIYDVWWGHTEVTGNDWKDNNAKRYSKTDLEKEIKGCESKVTHMKIYGRVPDIFSIIHNLTHLSILDLPVDDIPNLCKLQWLTKLQVLHLKVSDVSAQLPEDIWHMKNLKELHMNDCHLRSLPAGFAELTNLQVLSLSNTEFFPPTLPDVVCQLESLHSVFLKGCKLTHLPSSLSNLTNLEMLDVSHNNFGSAGLPSAVCELQSLKDLNLIYCHLRNLPDRFSKLTNLKVLHLSYNEFSPDELLLVVYQLSSLKTLFLYGSQRRGLPDSLANLTKLEILDLDKNDFSQGVPEAISQLTSLRELHMLEGQFTGLPKSLANLTNLKWLKLSRNDFSVKLPDVISEMTNITYLDLSDCKLMSLPLSLSELKLLEILSLQANEFKTFPEVICELKKLKKLDLTSNGSLQGLHSDITSLSDLSDLRIDSCFSLSLPPYRLCKQGLGAIEQYYRDLLETGLDKGLPSATISIIGRTGSGKTSLVKTLQTGCRVLTGCSEGDPKSTKVFNFEEVESEDTKLRFIDFGGHEVYHITYQLTLRENCVPVIVVNMKMYEEEMQRTSEREAVKRLFFDWMAHLYLAQPNLVSPKLVFTHRDKFTTEEFEILEQSFLFASNSVRDSIVMDEKGLKRDDFQRIKQLSKNSDVFQPQDIHVVGDKTKFSTFALLKKQLHDVCKGYVQQIPKNWEEMGSTIQQLDTAFDNFENLLKVLKGRHKVDKSQLRIILSYMHDCGKLLWYKDVESLRDYVFHKIPVVTGLLNVLYDHNESTRWKKRRKEFRPTKIGLEDFLTDSYELAVEHFKETGAMKQTLLLYLIQTETPFQHESEVGLEILQSFRLILGPVQHDEQLSYLIPHFAVGWLASAETQETDVEFQVDVSFHGLSLPQYVYHEMTVGLLKPFTSEQESFVVKQNGGSVFKDGCSLSLVHNAKSDRATILLSCHPKKIDSSWELLTHAVNDTIEHVRKTWKAAILSCTFHCIHCKLAGKSIRRISNPTWCILSATRTKAKPYRKLSKGSCGDDHAVPSALLYPHEPLSQEERREIVEYVHSLKEMRRQAEKGRDESIQAISDHETFIYPQLSDIPTADLSQLELSPTVENLKKLYHDTNQVYEMSAPTRGRVLVINNYTGTRDRSTLDADNLKRLFTCLNFTVNIKEDRTCKEILSAIDEEVKEDEHEDFGMFILILMSHGTVNDCIYGMDRKAIQLLDVYECLSPQNFPAMKGKPKCIIVQACAGEQKDFGDGGRHYVREERLPEVVTLERPSFKSQPREKIQHLNSDDFVELKASSNGYAACRHPIHGSLFIRCLINVFYQHACDSDFETLCKMALTSAKKRQTCVTSGCYCITPTVLDCSTQSLTNFDIKQVEVKEIEKFEVLKLNNNKLQHVPDISNFSGIHTLDLSYNNISSIPSGVFSSLKQLLHLNISFNNLILSDSTISAESFQGLSNLMSLRMKQNRRPSEGFNYSALSPLNGTLEELFITGTPTFTASLGSFSLLHTLGLGGSECHVPSFNYTSQTSLSELPLSRLSARNCKVSQRNQSIFLTELQTNS